MLDCEEYYMEGRLLDRGKATQRIDDNLNAIQNSISFFKNNTLPVFKHYDDQGKLVVVSFNTAFSRVSSRPIFLYLSYIFKKWLYFLYLTKNVIYFLYFNEKQKKNLIEQFDAWIVLKL